jgi:hypothetical protein
MVDTRICVAHLPDPFFHIIPMDQRWFLVTKDVYTIVTIWMFVEMLAQGLRGEDHRTVVRFAFGLAALGFQRCLTLWLLPLCRLTTPVGTARFAELPTVDLGFFELPFRMFATNDLVFSGHVGEAVLFLLCTKNWRRSARIGLWIFLLVQCYALIAVRGHYTVDLLIAIPCAFFADLIAVKILTRATAGPGKGVV